MSPKIIIIGSGPGGISLAVELFELGIARNEILVLEKGENPIAAIRQFYPEKKMTLANYKGLPTETHGHLTTFPDLTKAETLVYFDELIKKYEIPLRLKSEVSKVIPRGRELQVTVGHDILNASAVGIGIGILGRPNKPEYKIPISLKDRCLFDITSQNVENQNVLVVGGGDTSSEYCQVLVQQGNQVTLAYRGDAFHRMMEVNRKALEDLSTQKKVSVRLKWEIQGVEDSEGKPKVTFKDLEKFPVETFDRVIYSIGGTTPLNFLRTLGVTCENNWPVVGPSSETNIPGVYLLGDLVAGKTGGSIITAYNASFRAAQHLKNFLNMK